MKRIISLIFFITIFIITNIASAENNISVEFIDGKGNYVYSLLPKTSDGYLFEFRGEEYLIGKNASEYTLPIKYSEKNKGYI